MAPKIVFDRARCEGFFVCSSVDPDNWQEDADEDKVTLAGAKEVRPGVYEKEIEEDDLADAATAAEGCPAGVIQVLDEDGNVIAGPTERPIER